MNPKAVSTTTAPFLPRREWESDGYVGAADNNDSDIFGENAKIADDADDPDNEDDNTTPR